MCCSSLWSPHLSGMTCVNDHHLANSLVMLLWIDPELKLWDLDSDMLVILAASFILCW